MLRRGKMMSKMDNNLIPVLDSLGNILKTLPEENHIKIHTCYSLTVPPQWKIEDRINDDFHIVFIKNGSGYYMTGDEKVSFERGKIIFVSHGMVHGARQNVNNPPFIIPVRFGIYNNNILTPVNFDLSPFSFAFVPHNIFEYQQLFEKLYKYNCKADKAFYNNLCGFVMSEILCRIMVELSRKNSDIHEDIRIEKVKQYMEANPLSRLNSDELADMASLSNKYFSHLFKKQYGVSPKEYQINIRLNYARFLIEETGQSIKQVAQTMGYPDQYSFSKQFKQVIGHSPSEIKVRK